MLMVTLIIILNGDFLLNLMKYKFQILISLKYNSHLLQRINMKRKNTSGYGTETFTYEIETTENYYDVTVEVKFYIQAPDYDSWASADDYYGYTDVLNVDITEIERHHEDGSSTFLSFSDLSSVELDEIRAKLDDLIEDQALGETIGDDY